jgi:spore maturation protein CgeB
MTETNRNLKVLVGYVDYPSAYRNVNQECQNYFARLRAAGFDVEGFCLTLEPPNSPLLFKDLDFRWRRGEKKLLQMYEQLEKKLEGKDIFINESGINLHPEFVEKLPVFSVYQCFDDIDGLNANLTIPAAYAYDFCLTGNIAEVETYKKHGLRNVNWIPIGFREHDYDSSITYEEILSGQRDIDLFMLIDRVSPYGNRPQRINEFASAFPEGQFYGKGWPRGYLSDAEELSYLHRAKIGPNIHLVTGPLNRRTYCLPANGVLQICDNKEFLGEIFKLDVEVVGFNTIPECIDLCKYYLAHDEERRRIAAEGWRRAMKDYNEVAVHVRTLEIIADHMPKRRDRPIESAIAVRHLATTKKQRAWDTLQGLLKRLLPARMQPAVKRTLFVCLSLIKSFNRR